MIDWYAITTTVPLLLVVEHETGRATAGSSWGPEAGTKQQVSKRASTTETDRQPNRHRLLERTNTHHRRWRCELEAEPDGPGLAAADGIDVS